MGSEHQFLLTSRGGLRRARRDARADAERIGLANRGFGSKPDMLAAADATLREVAERSPVAVSIIKSAINAANGLTTSAALDQERTGFRQAFTSEDMREGTRAFIGKRAPVFIGK